MSPERYELGVYISKDDYEITIGRAACEAYRAQWNFVAN
jgi:hypothetical protein